MKGVSREYFKNVRDFANLDHTWHRAQWRSFKNWHSIEGKG
jgi:hypothetical protein